MSWFLYLIAIASGAANPFQAGANSELNKQLGQPLLAGIIIYTAGLLGVLLIQAILAMIPGHSLPQLAKLHQVPWWAWTGGIVSIASTLAGLALAHKLGSTLFTGLSLAASVITSVMLDQFGLAGFRQHAASPARLVGCALMIAGLWLVARF